MSSFEGSEYLANNCLQFVAVALVVYDWVLMLGDEIELIWMRPMKANAPCMMHELMPRPNSPAIFPVCSGHTEILGLLACSRARVRLERLAGFDPSQTPRSVRILALTDIAALMSIIAMVQVLLQTRIYATYGKSKLMLWTNAALFVVEAAITILLVFRLSSRITPGHASPDDRCRACTVHPRAFAAAYVAPLCYESYLVFLAVRMSWRNRESSRLLGASSILDVLARGSALYFIIVASGMALSMVMFAAAPEFARWVDLMTDATSSIGGARLILSVRKAVFEETWSCAPAPHADAGTNYGSLP